jgi:glycerol-3-phosphate acyltransferase PlsX
MGGDYAPEATVLGAIQARKEFAENHQITLVGDSDIAKEILKREAFDASLFEFIHTTETIQMGDHATKAMRKKPNSSISVGFNLLGEKKLDVFASAGNSGAMLIGSMFSIRPIGGVIRPCITSVLPKESGGVGVILDVGINADCKPDVLYQFAILGSLYAEFVFNIKNPKVGLLNIGEEKEKGNLLTQSTHQLMADSEDFNFVGNIEGREIFEDKADVVVCDGFTGNVILKQAEAFYTLLRKRGLMDQYFERFNYEIYGGTPVLGVNGNVLIGHGISSPKAIKNMLLLGLNLAEADLPNKIKKAFK